MFIVPGLTGGGDAVYIKHISKEGVKRGYSVVVVNGRGINGTPLTVIIIQTFRTNQLGSSQDLDFIIKNIKKEHPDSKIVGIGASMGANQLLKYAGEQGSDSLIEGFCALSTPFDIVTCSRYLRKRMPQNFIPDQYLVVNMLKVLKSNEYLILKSAEELGINIEEVYNTQRSFEFDTKYTCKLLGYKNPEQYYRESSSVQNLHNIKKPTLAISALDDPVVTKDCIPYEEFKTNPNIMLAVTRRGVHLGWFTGMSPKRVSFI